LGFQKLENSTILIEKENVFAIVGILLYHAIPSSELEILYNETKWLETNANDYKWGPSMGGSIMCMFAWRKNMYKSNVVE